MVYKWCIKWGIATLPQGYWTKKRKNKSNKKKKINTEVNCGFCGLNN